MILYNNVDLFDKSKFIFDINAFFNVKVTASQFEQRDLDIIRRIDKAELLDRNLGTIKTPFGVTDIKHLSSGCKVVLVYLYLIRNLDEYRNVVLNISEAGENAAIELIGVLSGDSVEFYVSHIESIENLQIDNIVFNGVSTNNIWEDWS